MLCDRDNTNVAGSQPGFLDFVVMPLYQVMTSFLPKIADECIPNLKANKATWQSYTETEEDKQVYLKKDTNAVVPGVKGIFIHNIDTIEEATNEWSYCFNIIGLILSWSFYYKIQLQYVIRVSF